MAVESFTKWLEAEAITTVTQRSIKKFLSEKFICRFGFPHTLISDNGPQLKGEYMTRFCDSWHIVTTLSAINFP